MRFLVNSRVVESTAWGGTPALDFIRGELGLLGTKEGCREGDCGACAVLVGDFAEGLPRYRAHPSCLMSLGELSGRHLVTIEGLAEGADYRRLEAGLTPVMRALLEENGSQCGFCSPGFVVSLTAWLLEGDRLDEQGALRAVEGNLCRCTGYASIRRAARLLLADFPSLPAEPVARIEKLVARGVVPDSLLGFARNAFPGIGSAAPLEQDRAQAAAPAAARVIGGGSDLYVRDPHPEPAGAPYYPRLDPSLTAILDRGGEVAIGGGVSVRDFFGSPLIQASFPGIEAFESTFASILVRNRATLAGNIVNASPVADLTSMLLALGARLLIAPRSTAPRDGEAAGRVVDLEAFFLGYKKIDLGAGEIVAEILVPKAAKNDRFNFEKLSKRESLDIAAVNSALRLSLSADGGRIDAARISAGGIAALPRLLGKAAGSLVGKSVSVEAALEASRLAAGEIEPISDARGSAEYRRLALARLVLAHFARLFPALGPELAVALRGQP